jgi:hypothetical protein
LTAYDQSCKKDCENPISRIRTIALANQGETWGTGGNLYQLEFVLNQGIVDEDGPPQSEDGESLDLNGKQGQRLPPGLLRVIPTESVIFNYLRGRGATDEMWQYLRARYLEEKQEKDLPLDLS